MRSWEGSLIPGRATGGLNLTEKLNEDVTRLVSHCALFSARTWSSKTEIRVWLAQKFGSGPGILLAWIFGHPDVNTQTDTQSYPVGWP